jgi:hypothetical protein
VGRFKSNYSSLINGHVTANIIDIATVNNTCTGVNSYLKMSAAKAIANINILTRTSSNRVDFIYFMF